MALRGIRACIAGLVLLAILPNLVASHRSWAIVILRAAAICLGFTSATVVNSLTAFASLQCDDVGIDQDTGKPTKEHPELAKGKALGAFRSAGQLGRAIGPLLGACKIIHLCTCLCLDKHVRLTGPMGRPLLMAWRPWA